MRFDWDVEALGRMQPAGPGKCRLRHAQRQALPDVLQLDGLMLGRVMTFTGAGLNAT